MGEFDLIRRIRSTATTNRAVAVGIGDDCASIRFTPGAEILVTTDMLLDGRHFRLVETSAEEVGAKCLAVNLSDIAAMAGRPVGAVVAVALPRGDARSIAEGLQRGLNNLARAFDLALVGGDTNAWDGPLVVSITVFGETVGRGAVLRSGARPGDVVLVTGPLGGSLLGRHLRPVPRVREALTLNSLVAIHAMIDLSDGLAGDLAHILKESGGLGATLDADSIPIHPDVYRLLDGVSPLDHALTDGEDFELCLTLDPDDAARLLARPVPGVNLIRVGTIDNEPGLRIRRPDGSVEPYEGSGFDHLAGD